MKKFDENFPNYLVSDRGKIINSNTGKSLCPVLNSGGYLVVNLSKTVDGKKTQKMWVVARAVATAYVENPKGFKWVSYRDLDKTNVKSSNLGWVKSAESYVGQEMLIPKRFAPMKEVLKELGTRYETTFPKSETEIETFIFGGIRYVNKKQFTSLFRQGKINLQ